MELRKMSIAWLEKSQIYPKIYWKGKGDTEEIVAVGIKQAYREPQRSKAPLFGGMRFMHTHKQDSIWQDFPDTYFFEPHIIHKTPFSSPTPYVCKGAYTHLPSYPEWEASIDAVLNSTIEKVVLARKTCSAANLNPFRLLRSLLQPHLTCFLFQPKQGVTFLGATPEILYKRSGDLIETEALAATRACEKANELLSGEKEDREFSMVKHHIHKELSSLCTTIQTPLEDTLMHAGHLVHKHCTFKGKLKQNIDDSVILSTLHPTPATAGFPKQGALDLIEKLEPFDRGWYAAPLGWISEETASVAVAIRSALIVESKIHIFTGAGIVTGSLPSAEWEELNLKALPFFRVLC